MAHATHIPLEKDPNGETLRRRLEELTVLHAVAVAGTEATSEDDLLQRATQLIGETLYPDSFGMLLLDPRTGALYAHASYHLSSGMDAVPVIPPDTGITGRVVREGRPVRVADVTQEPDYLQGDPHTRSELCVPLKIGGHILGVINAESYCQEAFTEADERLLSTFAGQLATAIDRLRGLEAAHTRAQQMTALYDVGRRVSAILTLDELLPEIAHLIGETLHLYNVEIALVEGDHLKFHAGYGGYPDAKSATGDVMAIGVGITGQAAATGQTILAPDVSQNADYISCPALPLTRAELAVPLRVKDDIIGVLSVKSDRVAGLDEHTAAVLEILAAQIAVAVQNARLYHTALQAAERFTALHWAGQQIISAGMEPERIYQAIHQATARIMPSEAFVIALLNESQEQMDMVYLVDRSGAQPPQSQPLEAGLSGHVLARGEPVILTDTQQLEGIQVVHYGDPEAVRSVLAVPLKLGDKVFGILSAQSYQPHTYTLKEQQLLEMLAAHAAVALDNARLLRAARERSAELEAVRQASLHVTAQLELDPVLHIILEHALNLAGADNTYIFLYKNDVLSFGAAHWAGGEHRRYDAMPREDGLTYAVARTGKAIIVPQVRHHPLFAATNWDGAVAGFPLRIGDEVIGVMNLTFDYSRRFDANELRALELLADQAAIAIRNAELFEATQRQVQELSVLHAVALAGAEALDEDELITRATELIGPAFYSTNFGVLLVDNTQGTLYFHPSYQGLPPALKSHRIPLGEGVTGRVALQGTPLRLDDLTQEADCIVLLPGMRSELCVPLRVGEQIIGVVNTQSHTPGAFNAADERLLLTFASQLATAIEKARLFSATAEALAREQHLDEITRIITSTLDLDEILPTVVRLAAELVSADAAMLSLVSENETAEAQPYVFSIPGHIARQTIPKGQGLTWRIIERGEALLHSDYAALSEALPALVEASVHSVIGVPITVGNETIGALELFGLRAKTHFSSSDIPLVESIGRQTGITIQNARLFTQAQQRAEALATALKRLEELDQLKSEFIQNVSHELRTPLAIIRGYAELLEHGDLGALAEEQHGPIEIIARRTRMLTKMVEDLTAILETETEKIHREPFALAEMAYAVVADFKANAAEVGVTLRTEIAPDPAPLFGDVVKFRRVLDNLIGNALKFTPEGGVITVRVWEADSEVLLEVADTGIGIPADKLDRIFERFYQIDGSMKRRYGGTGLGLALVKEIAKAHGGVVTVESTPGAGSTFRLTLPRYADGAGGGVA